MCVCGSGDRTGQTVEICTTKRGLDEICALSTESQQLLRMCLFTVKVRAANQCQYFNISLGKRSKEEFGQLLVPPTDVVFVQH